MAKAQVWATQVTDLERAEFNGWPIGEWVRSSVHSHYRTDQLDLESVSVRRIYQRYLAGGAAVAQGLDTLMTHERPQTQLLFNGRMAPTRVALELGKQHGVRTITEERGFCPDQMRIVRDSHCLDPRPFYGLEQTWRGVALTDDECKMLTHTLTSHLRGKGHEIDLFAAPPQGAARATESLGLDPDKLLLTLFASSTDEAQERPEAKGSFGSQHEWIEATVGIVAARPDIQLVVRAHPNSGGKRAIGKNAADVSFFETLSQDLPENVKIVAPEMDVSSYDLMAASRGGLIWHSSLGVEMAALGKPVLRAGAYWFKNAEFMIANDSRDTYRATFDELVSLAREPPSLDRTIQAWRFAYCWFYRQSIPFPLVKQPDWAHGEFNFDNPDALTPGQDESLDRICSIIMDNTPLYPEPDGQGGGSSENERAAVAAYLNRVSTV